MYYVIYYCLFYLWELTTLGTKYDAVKILKTEPDAFTLFELINCYSCNVLCLQLSRGILWVTCVQ